MKFCPAQCDIAQGHGPALCSIALAWFCAMRHRAGPWSSAMPHSAGPHIFVFIQILEKSSALCRIARDNTFSFISRRIRNNIRKHFRAWIRDLDGIVWRKNLKISWHCPFKQSHMHQNIAHIGLQCSWCRPKPQAWTREQWPILYLVKPNSEAGVIYYSWLSTILHSQPN
jgi:hypothetical protein